MFKNNQLFKKMKSSHKFFTILAFPSVLFSFLWDHLKTQDSLHYFSFADQRLILGVPNFFDVTSNFAFAVVGVYGLYLSVKNKDLFSATMQKMFQFFSVSIILVAFGSAYFHWTPTLYRLFWDRLPMSLGFASVLGMLVLDRTSEKVGKIFFAMALVFASTSTVLWHLRVWDLRPYVITQFGTLLMIVFILILFPIGRIKNSTYWKGFLFYTLAKVTESYDSHIFSQSHLLSGHTLKHVLAAWGIFEIMKFYSAEAVAASEATSANTVPQLINK